MNTYTAYNILENASVFIQLIPIAISLLLFKTFNTQLKVLFIYFIASFASEMLVLLLSSLNTGDVYLITNTYILVEFLIITFVYYKEFRLKKPYLLIAAGLIFLIVTCLKLTKQYNDISFSVSAIVIVILSVIYYFRLSGDLTISKLSDFYFFWINGAFLFYFSISFLLYLFLHYIVSNEATFISLWSIHHVANIIYNILLTIGLCKTKALSPR